MAVQKILSQQIANTGGTAGQVLVANSTGVTWGDANNATNLGGVAAASYVNTAGAYTRTGVTTFNANAVIGPTGELVFDANSGIYANGSLGTAGQVLTSNATTIYWANSSGGGGGFTNGQSISVNNFVVSGSFTANGSVGASGQTLLSTGTGVQWGTNSPAYNYSTQLNGAAHFFTFPSNAAFGFGTGDFTIECWIYPIILSAGSQPLIDFRNANSGAYPTLFINGSTVSYYVNSATRISAGSTISNNNWYHLALVRISGSTKLYINGVQSGSTYADTTNYLTSPITIGNFNDGVGGSYTNGLITNARVVKGTGVYTGAFTVPTSPLSAISGTSLLTCNSITPSDSSSYNFAPINNGLAVGTATQSPFTSTTVSIPTSSLTAVNQQFTGDGSTTTFSVAGGYTPNAIAVYYNGLKLRNGSDVTVTNGSTVVFAIAPQIGAMLDVVASVPTTYSSITPVGYSVLFNGTNQYFTIPNNTAFTMGTSDFTIEYWAYITSGSRDSSVYAKGATSAIYRLTTGFNTSNQVTAGIPNAAGNGWTQLLVGSAVSVNKWVHVALVRSAGTATLYLNGIAVASGAASNSLYDDGTALAIGTTGSVTPASYFAGYISNLRVVKGVAVYTGSFLPTGPLAAVQLATSTQSAITGTQTSLLTCNGPTIIDGSTNAFTITNNGTATVSTAIVPTFTNVTVTNTSNTAGGFSWQSVQSTNFTAVAGYAYPVNTTAGSITVTLPASPSPGNIVQITDYAGTFGTYPVTAVRNGSLITGLTINATLGSSRGSYSFVYIDSTQGWITYSVSVTNIFQPYAATYLMVAGGGGGSGGSTGAWEGGGGGAGGLLTGSTNLSPGTTYSFVVGGGGPGGAGGSSAGTSGSNSTGFTLSAIGGGNGRGSVGAGGAGGSGGGTWNGAGGAGTVGQGNAGASGNATNAAGGGGGAGAVGGLSNGGVGAASSITGSAVTYAGGGGGSQGGVGGAGGGGNAFNPGTANLGGGGGGGSSSMGAGGTGGSGVVIISIPTANYTAATTGSPIVTTNGSNTIIKFTASGSYTA
jgi:hypothetical protein